MVWIGTARDLSRTGQIGQFPPRQGRLLDVSVDVKGRVISLRLKMVELDRKCRRWDVIRSVRCDPSQGRQSPPQRILSPRLETNSVPARCATRTKISARGVDECRDRMKDGVSRPVREGKRGRKTFADRPKGRLPPRTALDGGDYSCRGEGAS